MNPSEASSWGSILVCWDSINKMPQATGSGERELKQQKCILSILEAGIQRCLCRFGSFGSLSPWLAEVRLLASSVSMNFWCLSMCPNALFF